MVVHSIGFVNTNPTWYWGSLKLFLECDNFKSSSFVKFTYSIVCLAELTSAACTCYWFGHLSFISFADPPPVGNTTSWEGTACAWELSICTRKQIPARNSWVSPAHYAGCHICWRRHRRGHRGVPYTSTTSHCESRSHSSYTKNCSNNVNIRRCTRILSCRTSFSKYAFAVISEQ